MTSAVGRNRYDILLSASTSLRTKLMAWQIRTKLSLDTNRLTQMFLTLSLRIIFSSSKVHDKWGSYKSFATRRDLRLSAAGRGQHWPPWQNPTTTIRCLCASSDYPDEERDDQESLSDYDSSLLEWTSLPVGIPASFRVIQQYSVPQTCKTDWLRAGLDEGDISRLNLDSNEITLPVALMMVDPESYPTLSRARKVCRKGHIIIHQGPLIPTDIPPDVNSDDIQYKFDTARCIPGRVGDRVAAGDVIARQCRVSTGHSPTVYHRKPPFELPVLYEDDHFALVNKPAGVVVNGPASTEGIMTIRAALPFALSPSKPGTQFMLRRPIAVHRLDKPTSGILCVAKTRPAMQALCRQFHDRVSKKTYFAIINGIPDEAIENVISSAEAFRMGVDVDPDGTDTWQVIDSPLDGRSAVTVWRAVQYVKSLFAFDEYLTLIEVKLKTGRFHQIRRHMAWVCNRPVLGDNEYGGTAGQGLNFRERGLFLCATGILLEHPFFNSDTGRGMWVGPNEGDNNQFAKVFLADDNKVMVRAKLDLPNKFQSILNREAERYEKLSNPLKPQ